MNNDREVAQPFILHFTFTVYSLPLTFEDNWLGWSAKKKVNFIG